MVSYFLNLWLHPAQNRTTLNYLRPQLDDSTKKQLRADWISLNLGKLQQRLWVQSQFAVGDQFTLADIFVAVIYRKALSQGAAEIAPFEQHMELLQQQQLLKSL